MDQELKAKLRDWLGEEGISFFCKVKEQYGTLNACWVEGEFDDGTKAAAELKEVMSQHPPIPHPVHFREGMQVRNFLRTIYGDSWTAHDYDNRWAALIEEAINDN